MAPTFRSLPFTSMLVLEAALALGCTRGRDAAEIGAQRESTSTTARPATPPDEPRRGITRVEVPDDAAVLVVEGKPGLRRPIVHLHGMCEDPRGNLEAWGGAARDHGTLIALEGDVACPGQPGVTKWSDDAARNDARITAAIAAVKDKRGLPLDAGEVLLVGESMGAARAESLARTNPERYTRLVLVGSPQTASPTNLSGARAVANVVGEREPQDKAKAATRALEEAGIQTQFFELPGASHGAYGSDGESTMREALTYVARP